MRDPARPGEADEALEQFEQTLARRLRRMAQEPPPPDLQERGIDLIRSHETGSKLNGGAGDRALDAPRTHRER